MDFHHLDLNLNIIPLKGSYLFLITKSTHRLLIFFPSILYIIKFLFTSNLQNYEVNIKILLFLIYMSKYSLSKSIYQNRVLFYKNNYELKDPIIDSSQAVFDQGNQIDY